MNKENNAKKKIGETKRMKCGLNATIIEYRSGKDIDIQFEDNIIVKNKAYYDFCRGYIGHPEKSVGNRDKQQKIREERIGETHTMFCGMKATIKEYNNVHDITVQFEDGNVINGVSYYMFQKGKVGHPTLSIKGNAARKYQKQSRLGETRKMNCGLEATIIKYNAEKDIIVQFKTGEIMENQRYVAFKRGSICPHDWHEEKKGLGN